MNDFSKMDAQNETSRMAQIQPNELTDFVAIVPEEKIEQFLDLVEN